MEASRLFEYLNDSSRHSEHRSELIAHLNHQAAEMQCHPEQTLDIAYAITGIMATDFARALADDDPLSEILTIAGELEINPVDATELRSELLQAIEKLQS